MQISCGSPAKDVLIIHFFTNFIVLIRFAVLQVKVPNMLLSDYNFIPSFFVGASSLTLSNTIAGCSVNNSEVKELSGFHLY